jgi:hypothetical protein
VDVLGSPRSCVGGYFCFRLGHSLWSFPGGLVVRDGSGVTSAVAVPLVA